MNRLHLSLFIVGSTWLNASQPTAAVTIETVRIANVGNPGDVQVNGIYGSVNYEYRIGKYEVTNAQYVDFLNAVDATGANALGLYNSAMATAAVGGIEFNAAAADGSKYSIKPGREKNPVVLVSWYDAIRFANWLHNGQGSSDTETGAYTILGGTPTPSNGESIMRNAEAKWFLPTEGEWYKAAYHKNDGVTGNYWEYPTSTDAIPYSDQPPGSDAPDPSNTANFWKAQGGISYDEGYAVTGSQDFDFFQNYLTDVGSYVSANGAYGTFDQGGNVSEWLEDLDVPAQDRRRMRGGSWQFHIISTTLSAQHSGGSAPASSDISGSLGFRVATLVPEPDGFGLIVLGGILSGARAYSKRHCQRHARPSVSAGKTPMGDPGGF